MTENEAKAVRFIKYIKNYAVETLDHIDKGDAIASTVTHMGKKEKAETILAMVEELKKYRAIGTPEECRVAMKKQTAKKIESPWCPCCGKFLTTEYMNKRYHCIYCGQLLEWEGER